MRDLAAAPTRDLIERRDRVRLMRRKAGYVAGESDRLSSEAVIELGQLRRLLREDDERITAEIDRRVRMGLPLPSLFAD